MRLADRQDGIGSGRSIDGSTDFLGIELSCAAFEFRRYCWLKADGSDLGESAGKVSLQIPEQDDVHPIQVRN